MKTRNRPLRGTAAFTLTETLISVTIASTAMVSLLGLISTGLGLSTKNTCETVAPVLARRVAAEVTMNYATLIAGSSTAPTTPASPPTPVNLYDSSLLPVTLAAGTTGSTAYQNGVATTTNAAFLVTWTFTDRSVASNLGPALGTGMQTLTVSVETPAGAPAATRQHYIYATLLNL